MSIQQYASQYSSHIRKLLQKDDIDLATITTKSIRKQLERDFNVQFSAKDEKKAINELIGQIYDEVTEQEEEDTTEDKSYGLSDDEYVESIKQDSLTSKSTGINHTNLVSSEDDMNSDSVDSDVYDDEVKAGSKRKRSTSSKKGSKDKKKKTTKKRAGGGGGGLMAPLILSAELGGFLGAKEMSRTQIVKKLWEYIKKNNLQDPTDKRFIISDSKLRKVFGVDRFSGFSMSKMLNDHLTKLDGTSCKRERTEEEEKAEKAKKAARKKGKTGEKTKRSAPNNGFNKPMLLSPTLSAFLGNVREMSRPQVVKQIWEYIKEKGLQDASDKRYILCDDQLYSVFKTKRVHMFQMNKILADHLRAREDVVGIKEEVVIDDDPSFIKSEPGEGGGEAEEDTLSRSSSLKLSDLED